VATAPHITLRIQLAGLRPRQRVGHRTPYGAIGAHHLADGAVQLQHLAGGHPGELVQTVHVLRDHPHRRGTGPLQPGDGTVRRVRLGGQRAVLPAQLPGPAPDVRVAHVVLVRHQLLGLGVAAPDTVRSAVVRDAGVGADPGTGEERDEGLAHAAEGRRRGPARATAYPQAGPPLPLTAPGGRPPAPRCPSRRPGRPARPAPGGPAHPAGRRSAPRGAPAARTATPPPAAGSPPAPAHRAPRRRTGTPPAAAAPHPAPSPRPAAAPAPGPVRSPRPSPAARPPGASPRRRTRSCRRAAPSPPGSSAPRAAPAPPRPGRAHRLRRGHGEGRRCRRRSPGRPAWWSCRE